MSRDEGRGGSEGAYGARIASTFSAELAGAITTQLHGETFAITRVRSSVASRERTAPLQRENAFIIGFQLVDRGNVELWTGNRLAYKGYHRAGTASIVDVALEPSAVADGVQDRVFYYLRRSVLDDLSLEADGGMTGDLVVPPGRPFVDPVISHLSHALLPALEHPEHVTRLFFEHVALALKEHVSARYTHPARPVRRITTALAPWQVRRAKELISRDLQGNVSIAELAAECRLSRSHFMRAFKETTGMPPHRWLTLQRIETAKTLMRTTAMPLGSIAKACGFAHQSHFSRVFSTFVGTWPSTWRRDESETKV